MERSATSFQRQEACVRFEELLTAMRTRELTEDEWSFYLEHDEACQSDHVKSKLEELPLESEALETEASQEGVLSARELEEQTLRLIHLLREQVEASPATVPSLENCEPIRGKSSWCQAWPKSLPSCWAACDSMLSLEVDHYSPARSWRTGEEAGPPSATKEPLLVVWDRMPNHREIPALRRLLELSIVEFWMVLITYRHMNEAGSRVETHKKLLDDWDVLFWRDTVPSIAAQCLYSFASKWHWPNDEALLLKKTVYHWDWASLRKRAITIVAPSERGASERSHPATRREALPGAKEYAKGREVVRLDELLKQSLSSSSPLES